MDFKHRNGTRVCPTCGTILKRNGHTKKGTQKGYCKKCKKTLNPNQTLQTILKKKSIIKFYIKYLLSTIPLKYLGLSKQQFMRLSKPIRETQINPLCDYFTYSKVIYLDAIYFADRCCLIARNNKYVIGGKFCYSENSYEGFEFIKNFPAPPYAVCDGGCGLVSAMKQAGPKTKHQRCLFHVGMSIRQKLTLHPDTQPGRELLIIGRKLLNINTNEEKIVWLESFKMGRTKYEEFVSQMSKNDITGEVWFTHKELRSAAYNLAKLILENNLFYYLEDNDVSRTNNFLEGGINSRLKQLLYFHRRCCIESKIKLIEFYLLKRSKYFNEITNKLYLKIK